MTLVAQGWHRVRQFNKAVAGRITQPQHDDVRAVLGSGLYQLFAGMRPGAQRHGYDVLMRVRSDGPAVAGLWAAALLHDVGKGYLGALPRVAWVVAGVAGPRLRSRLASHRLGSWLGLETNLHHAEVGARMVAARGGSPVLVRLVAGHYRRDPDDVLLCCLQRADDDN